MAGDNNKATFDFSLDPATFSTWDQFISKINNLEMNLKNATEKLNVLRSEMEGKGGETFLSSIRQGSFGVTKGDLDSIRAFAKELGQIQAFVKMSGSGGFEKGLMQSLGMQSAVAQLAEIQKLLKGKDAAVRLGGFDTESSKILKRDIDKIKDISKAREELIRQEGRLSALMLSDNAPGGQREIERQKLINSALAERIKFLEDIKRLGSAQAVNLLAESRAAGVDRQLAKGTRERALTKLAGQPLPADLSTLNQDELKRLLASRDLAIGRAARTGKPTGIFDADILQLKTALEELKVRENEQRQARLRAIREEAQAKAQAEREAMRAVPWRPNQVYTQRANSYQMTEANLARRNLQLSQVNLDAETDQELKYIRTQKIAALRAAYNNPTAQAEIQAFIDALDDVVKRRKDALLSSAQKNQSLLAEYRRDTLYGSPAALSMQTEKVDSQAEKLRYETMLRLRVQSAAQSQLSLEAAKQIQSLEEIFIQKKASQLRLEQSSNDAQREYERYLQRILSLQDRKLKAQIQLDQNPNTTNVASGPRLLTENELAIQRQNIHNRMFGDGGANMMMNQTMILAHYQMLNGIQSLFSGAIGAAIQLDSAMRQLQAISASTNHEMVDLKDNLMEVAKGTKFSAVEISNAAITLAQAGFRAEDIKNSMKAIATLAQASGSDLSQAVDVTTSVLSIYNMEAGQAMDISNKMTAALNMSKLTMDKLIYGIQYAGNTAAQSGVSFEELISALAALSNAGIRTGSTLGTGFQQVLLDLSKPSKKMIEILGRLGLSVYDVDIRAHGLEGVLNRLREAGFTTADAFEAFETRSGRAFAALSNSMDVYDTVRKEMELTTAGVEASAVQMESLSNKFEKLKTSLAIGGTKALEPMLQSVKGLVDGITKVTDTTAEWDTSLKVVGTSIGLIIGGNFIAFMAKMVVSFREYIGVSAVVTAANGRIATGFNMMTTAAMNSSAGMMAARMGAEGFIITARGVGSVLFSLIGGWAGLTTAMILAAGYFISTRKNQEDLNNELDKARGKLDATADAVDKIRASMSNIDETIALLSTRQNDLKTGSAELVGTIHELQGKFTDLQSTVTDVANTSVAQLIQALRDLRHEMSGEYVLDLKLKGQDLKGVLEAKLAATSKQYSTTVNQNKSNFGGSYVSDLTSSLSGMASPGELSAISNAAEFSMGKNPDYAVTGDYAKDQRLLNELVTKLSHLGRNDLRQKVMSIIEANKTMSSMNMVMSKYSSQLSEVDSVITSQINTESLIDSGQEASDSPSRLIDKMNRLKSVLRDASSKKTSTFLNGPGGTKVEIPGGASGNRLGYLSAALNQAQGMKETYKGRIDQLSKKDGLTREQSQANDYFITQLSEALSGVTSLISDLEKEKAKSDIKIAQKQLEANEKAISTQNVRITDSGSIPKVQSATKVLIDLLSRKGEIEKVKTRAQAIISGTDSETLDQQLHEIDKATSEAIAKANEAKKHTVEELVKPFKELGERIKDEKRKVEIDNTDSDYKSKISDINNSYEIASKASAAKVKALQAAVAQLTIQEKKGLVSTEMVRRKKIELEQAQEDGVESLSVATRNRLEALIAVNTSLKNTVEKLKTQNDSDQANLDKLQQIGLKTGDKSIKLQTDDLNRTVKERTEQISKLQDLIDKSQQNIDQSNGDIENLLVKQQELDSNKRTRPTSFVGQTQLGYNNWYTSHFPEDSNTAWTDTVTAGLNKATDAMGQFLTAVESTSIGTKEAFKDMGNAILQEMLSVINSAIAKQFLNMMFNLLGSAFGGGASAGAPGGLNINTSAPSVGADFLAAPHAQGGVIKKYAGGGLVSGAPFIGRDNVPAMLEPGEGVLTRSAVSVMGSGLIDSLNADAAKTLSNLKPNVVIQDKTKDSGSGVVNVWVVTPDQQAGMGKDDVVVTVADDIRRGGSIRSLIKQVQMGG